MPHGRRSHRQTPPWRALALIVAGATVAAVMVAALPARARAQSGETGGIGGTGLRGSVSGGETGGIGGTGVNGETGGIGGTGAPIVGFGPIQRFGSVFVNGREYRVSGRTLVSMDGHPATVASLRVGDMAIVRGVATGPHRGVARFISTWQSIVGPVSSIAPDRRSLTILGQTVTVPPGTPDFKDLRPGVTAGISAQRQANGNWIATNVTILPPSHAFRLETTVTAVQGGHVALGGLSLRANPALLTGIQAGDRVVATGTIRGGKPTLTALTPRPIALGKPGTRVEIRNFFRSAGGGKLIAADGIEATGAPHHEALSGLEPTEIDGRIGAHGIIAITSMDIDVPEQPLTTTGEDSAHGGAEPGRGSERPGAGETHDTPAAHQGETAEPHGESQKEVTKPGETEPSRNAIEPPEVGEASESAVEPEIETPEIELPEQQAPEPDIDAPEIEPPSDR